MTKIVFSYVAIFCLLILVSANTITTSLKRTNATECADLAEEAEDQQVPSPVEEDTSEDDENSKLIPHHTHGAACAWSGKLTRVGHFLTSFHFLEIISPPPQA
ncbi:MAG: hypothetical protein KIT62_16755 [Cyclobacteriaceae bacterium]|nr:hypothetical protein [Cyclobacteriaceae bacterium]